MQRLMFLAATSPFDLDQRHCSCSPLPASSSSCPRRFPTVPAMLGLILLGLLPVLPAGPAGPACQKGSPGLSLLAHKRQLHKSAQPAQPGPPETAGDIFFPSYNSPWCPCGGYPEYCGLIQTDASSQQGEGSDGRYNQTAQCHEENCGEHYPASPFACANVGGQCIGVAGNCLYSTSMVVNTSESCGSRECFCAKVAPGQCTAENFPGYEIVQNGAYNLTTGKKWHPVGDGSSFVYPPDLRAWEPVGGPGNHACRADNSSDNNPDYYRVHNIHSLSECKDLCERTDFCTGIEYSAGRCEIWMKCTGMHAFKEIPVEKGEFTCLRYGWPISKMVPVGPPGTTHPCRGRSSSDNHPKHYEVVTGVTDIEVCKAYCAARTGLPCSWYHCEPKCSGIEWSLGRCELWFVEIEAVNPNVDGFTCLKFDLSASY